MQTLPSLGHVHGGIHKLVLNSQFEHFNVPVYPAPFTPAHVAPPKEVPSHFSVPSRIPFPHTEAQSLSFNALHPLGQHPSFDLHAVIEGYEHLLFEHTLVLHVPEVVHWETDVQQSVIGIC